MNAAARDVFAILAAIGWLALLVLGAAGIHGPEAEFLGQNVPALEIGILACLITTGLVLLWPGER